MTRSGAPRPSFLRSWLIWSAGFLAFPLAGLAGTAVAGRVDTPVAALLGGAVTGLVIGAGQAVVSSRRLDPRRWIPATAAGMSVGLLLGAAAVGYRTSLGDLALMGALTGLVLGVAQAVALPRGTHRRWVWAAALPVLWALGWTATTLGGIAVDQQFTVFGAYGAITFSALSGLLLHRLLPHPAKKCPARKSPARKDPAGSGPHTQRHGAVIRSRHVMLGTDARSGRTPSPRGAAEARLFDRSTAPAPHGCPTM